MEKNGNGRENMMEKGKVEVMEDMKLLKSLQWRQTRKWELLEKGRGWEDGKTYMYSAGQIRGQMSVCRAWKALPNNVEHIVGAVLEPFQNPTGNRTWVP